MSMAPQGVYQWLSAVSVPVAGFAARYIWGLTTRFAVLEALFKKKEVEIDKLDAQQRQAEIQLALHDQLINQVKVDLASISGKLESLPRIATMLENLMPMIQKIVPREELEQRFVSIHQQLVEIKQA
jgi:hypothetical protein